MINCTDTFFKEGYSPLPSNKYNAKLRRYKKNEKNWLNLYSSSILFNDEQMALGCQQQHRLLLYHLQPNHHIQSYHRRVVLGIV